jgi:hypothetical protein
MSALEEILDASLNFLGIKVKEPQKAAKDRPRLRAA